MKNLQKNCRVRLIASNTKGLFSLIEFTLNPEGASYEIISVKILIQKQLEKEKVTTILSPEDKDIQIFYYACQDRLACVKIQDLYRIRNNSPIQSKDIIMDMMLFESEKFSQMLIFHKNSRIAANLLRIEINMDKEINIFLEKSLSNFEIIWDGYGPKNQIVKLLSKVEEGEIVLLINNNNLLWYSFEIKYRKDKFRVK